jgi:hypothetical protein
MARRSSLPIAILWSLKPTRLSKTQQMGMSRFVSSATRLGQLHTQTCSYVLTRGGSRC